MCWFGDNSRRCLQAFSRHPRTRRRLLIELNAEGTDYIALGDTEVDDFNGGWEALFTVLDESDYKMSRRTILEQWPQDHAKPAAATLWRWLERAVNEGKVLREGCGTRLEPFRYWLPGQEERWAADPDRLPELAPFDSPLADVWDEMKVVRAAGKILNRGRGRRRRDEEDAEE